MTIEYGTQSTESAPRAPYQAFLLRCWQEVGDGKPVWRFTLLHLDSKQVKRGFANLEDLLAYIKQELKCLA